LPSINYIKNCFLIYTRDHTADTKAERLIIYTVDCVVILYNRRDNNKDIETMMGMIPPSKTGFPVPATVTGTPEFGVYKPDANRILLYDLTGRPFAPENKNLSGQFYDMNKPVLFRSFELIQKPNGQLVRQEVPLIDADGAQRSIGYIPQGASFNMTGNGNGTTNATFQNGTFGGTQVLTAGAGAVYMDVDGNVINQDTFDTPIKTHDGSQTYASTQTGKFSIPLTAESKAVLNNVNQATAAAGSFYQEGSLGPKLAIRDLQDVAGVPNSQIELVLNSGAGASQVITYRPNQDAESTSAAVANIDPAMANLNTNPFTTAATYGANATAVDAEITLLKGKVSADGVVDTSEELSFYSNFILNVAVPQFHPGLATPPAVAA
jgi:hypothetical protein